MSDLSKLVEEAYQRYILDISGKKVATPYRINIPYQPDRRKYGKSTPSELMKSITDIAQENQFDLENSSIEEIRKFMKDNMLGIDCSGFVYHILNDLLKNINKPTLEQIGFPKASSTNVLRLTADEFTDLVENISDIQVGDMIKFTKGSDEDIAHIMLIAEVTPEKIVYIQATEKSDPDGIQKKNINIIDSQKGLESQNWEEILHDGKKRSDYYKPQNGDGVRRLKVLS